jgi:tetratricopeptide (TPR) repeat protein
MPRLTTAEQLNEDGWACDTRGDITGAEAAFRAAMAASPLWAIPHYNLGLLCKYQRRWEESFSFTARATELTADHEAAWWNLGIAATALRRWSDARHAWERCGIAVPEGEGEPDFGWGLVAVRLDPDTYGEVVWARRIDPARAQIVGVPLPSSDFQWGDTVLTDVGDAGERMLKGKTYPVFNLLDTLERSWYRKFVIELATADEVALDKLAQIANELGGAASGWGRTTHILCRTCSLGAPHTHSDSETSPAFSHVGVAAKDRDHAQKIIERWLAECPTADLVSWYGG